MIFTNLVSQKEHLSIHDIQHLLLRETRKNLPSWRRKNVTSEPDKEMEVVKDLYSLDIPDEAGLEIKKTLETYLK